jgi:hypothetical protein
MVNSGQNMKYVFQYYAWPYRFKSPNPNQVLRLAAPLLYPGHDTVAIVINPNWFRRPEEKAPRLFMFERGSYTHSDPLW